MAYVNRPGIADAAHVVTTEQILDDIRERHPQHPQIAAITRIARTVGVTTRRFVRPLADVARTEEFQPRNERAFGDVCALAEHAGKQALKEAGIEPSDIGALITFHATGLAIPGLDVHLVQALDLPQTVTRIPLTQVACAGGAQALGLAASLVRPARPVLVAGAEALSSVYQHTDTGLPSMIYKMLFGDGGAAAVVSVEPLQQPGLHIDDTWTYVHRDNGQPTEHYYKLRADRYGYHFDSTRAAVTAVSQVVPRLPWLADGWQPSFGIIHPGSPRILDLVTEAGGCPNEALVHSRASLAEDGNVGGTAVLRVLARTHDAPPPDGAEGLLFGVGPGFCAAASRVRWTAARRPDQM
ncbi:PhlD [Streptomyces minutiscleroticus]|uniref:Polyketide synthase n=1 Tax=Streptomyces minutiscleroticus TaxID=68238 RepID=A0A918NZA9_9ACTN|nr:PhlD [Streptomyces minutiscleroticus]GGY07550.1 polyketide synthase [Streptomyces minutiscleroticus]